MDRNSKIYVAGHNGLVGQAIVSELEKQGYTNLLLRSHSELDLTNQADTLNFFEKEKPEYVINAAAKVGGILANSTYPAEFIYQNIMIGTNIVHSGYLTGVKKLLNLGSSCIYPNDISRPITENDLLTGKLEQTNEAYAIAKISVLKLCKFYNEQYGTNFISLMPTNQYGIGDNFNMETAHVLPMVLRRMHLGKLLMNNDFDSIVKDIKKYKLGWDIDNNIDFANSQSIKLALEKVGVFSEKIKLWGNGNVYREFMSSDDLANACIYILKNTNYEEIGEVINITRGTDIKLSELFELIKSIVNYEGNLEYDNSKPNGTFRKLLDNTKLKQIGWEPKLDLETGIRNLYDWYLGEVL